MSLFNRKRPGSDGAAFSQNNDPDRRRPAASTGALALGDWAGKSTPLLDVRSRNQGAAARTRNLLGADDEAKPFESCALDDPDVIFHIFGVQIDSL